MNPFGEAWGLLASVVPRRYLVTCNIATMTSKSGKNQGAGRVAKHRSELRQKGLKPAQIWVADTSSDDTVAALEAACLAINAADHASGDAEFAYALSEDK